MAFLDGDTLMKALRPFFHRFTNSVDRKIFNWFCDSFLKPNDKFVRFYASNSLELFPEGIIQRIQVRTTTRSILHNDEIWQIALRPGLSCSSLMGWRGILLKKQLFPLNIFVFNGLSASSNNCWYIGANVFTPCSQKWSSVKLYHQLTPSQTITGGDTLTKALRPLVDRFTNSIDRKVFNCFCDSSLKPNDKFVQFCASNSLELFPEGIIQSGLPLVQSSTTMKHGRLRWSQDWVVRALWVGVEKLLKNPALPFKHFRIQRFNRFFQQLLI